MSFSINLAKSQKYVRLFTLSRLSFSISAKLNSSSKQIENPSIKYRDNFDCIYKFRYINHLRLFSRMKIYQTGLSVLSGVGSIILYNAQIVKELSALLYINGAMVFALIMLFVISRQTVKIIGRIYLSDDQSKVLISHLDFFGKRRDMEINLEDIESLSSIDELSEKFFKLRLKNLDGYMLVSLPLGEIYDKNAFLKLFKINLKQK